jgi:hypothetical protein
MKQNFTLSRPSVRVRAFVVFVIAALLSGAPLISPAASAGETIVERDSGMTGSPHKFTLDESSVLTKYEGPGGSVEIPNTVVAVGASVFENNTTITNVTFETESQLTVVERRAFFGCTNLANIGLPESLETIREYAFTNCKTISNLTLPKSLKIIERYAFSNCSGLTALTLPSGLTTIGGGDYNWNIN